jgi:alanine racemase
MTHYSPPLRLALSTDALVANWRWLAARSGPAACGAAVKANGYGLGAREVVSRLRAAGCDDFFVATWAEAADLADVIGTASLSVLHGLREADLDLAATLPARPVLNSLQQVARWRAVGGGVCDVMVDTGMNRLGLTPQEALSGALDGLAIDTLMSHLACADEDVPMNAAQLATFREVAASIPARRLSLANSAGICLGSDYAFGLTRPGLALYGGVPRAEAAGAIRQVMVPQTEILQLRTVRAGQSVGYAASWTAERDTRVAIVNLGYADGYLRSFSGRGSAHAGGQPLPVVGRVSMDLIALAVPDGVGAGEGDWVDIDYDLTTAAATSGLSAYELLTGLGNRYQRVWS